MLSHSSELGGGKSNAAALAGRAGGAASSCRGVFIVGGAGVAGGVSVIELICLVRLLGDSVHEPESTTVHSIGRAH